MRLRHPWLIHVAGFLGAGLVRLLMGTVRYRFQGQPVDPNDPLLRDRYIYAFWHESMLFPAGRKTRAKFQVLISRHADGELIAQICRRLGFQVVRGSTTRGGVEAVRKMLRLSRDAHLAVTPDGPRGPRRQVQPGIIYLASKTGLPIVPAGIGFEKAWRAGSWDHFAVPRPWSTATCVIGEVIHVPPDLDRDQIECYRQRVEQELLAATEEAEKAHARR